MVQEGSRWLKKAQKVQEGSGKFRKVQEGPGRHKGCYKVLESSRRFEKV